jgi:uncharacterized protein with HEPN domain
MRHMLDATKLIGEYVSRGREAFDGDSALRDAIVYQIIVIGEASKAVVAADKSIIAEMPEIEWSPWARMRDRVTHKYWATDREMVWSTAQTDAPSCVKTSVRRSLV